MSKNPLRSSAGFTYIAVLVMVVIMVIVSTQAYQTWTMKMRREREAELIYHGTQVRDAMRRWYGLTLKPYGAYVPPGTSGPVGAAVVVKIPPGARRLNDLDDLVQDPSSAGKKHYLRPSNLKVQDPATGQYLTTGKNDWEYFKDPSGRITGVFIKSVGLPIKQDFSDHPDLFPDDFTAKKKYSDWVFVCDRYPTPGTGQGSQKIPGFTPGSTGGSSPGGTGNPTGNTNPNPGVP